MKLSGVPNARPFKPGPDPRRYMGGPLSPAEREFRAALEAKHIPKADALLAQIYETAVLRLADGDTRAAELFFKICGLIRKPTDQSAIEAQARALLQAMLDQARQQREGQPQVSAPIDVGTDE